MSESITGFEDDFSQGLSPDRWMAYEMKWGAGNNGVVSEYIGTESDRVVLWNGQDLGDRETVALYAHGEQFTSSPIKTAVAGIGSGRARNGAPSRVGACLASRDYFCSGTFEVDLKVCNPWIGQRQLTGQPPSGVLFSMWTFGYEEHFADQANPGTLNQRDLQYQPKVRQGSTGAFYSTVNTEIDCPEMGKAGSFTEGLFNCYMTEVTGNIQTFRYPNNIMDGRYHRYAFTWETELVPLEGLQDSQVKKFNGHFRISDPSAFPNYQGYAITTQDGKWFCNQGKRVVFYVDGQKVGESGVCSAVASRLIIGLWFPSWAGVAAWEFCRFNVARVAYKPYHNAGDVWDQAESYPYSGSVAILPPKGMPPTSRLAKEQREGFQENFESSSAMLTRWKVSERDVAPNSTSHGCVPENVQLDQAGKALLWGHGDTLTSTPIRPVAEGAEMLPGGSYRINQYTRVGSSLTTSMAHGPGTFEVDFVIEPKVYDGTTVSSQEPSGMVFRIWSEYEEEHTNSSNSATEDDPQFNPDKAAARTKPDGSQEYVSTTWSKFQFDAGLGGSYKNAVCSTATSPAETESSNVTLGSSLADGSLHTLKVVWEATQQVDSNIKDADVSFCNGYYRLIPSSKSKSAAFYSLPLIRTDVGTWAALLGSKCTFFLDGNQIAQFSKYVSPIAARLSISAIFPEETMPSPWEFAAVEVRGIRITPTTSAGAVWFQRGTVPRGLITPQYVYQAVLAQAQLQPVKFDSEYRVGFATNVKHQPPPSKTLAELEPGLQKWKLAESTKGTASLESSFHFPFAQPTVPDYKDGLSLRIEAALGDMDKRLNQADRKALYELFRKGILRDFVLEFDSKTLRQ
eukprot:ANDGO_04122.mRNA.1 hypothetical protein